MEWLLLWILLGLIGYCLLAYADILEALETLNNSLYLDKWQLPFSKIEMLRGMFFALLLGPLTIGLYILR